MKRRRGRPIGAPLRFASTGETVQEVAARLGLTRRAIELRLSSYGWSEKDTLTLGKRNRRDNLKCSGLRRAPRPGVRFRLLTPTELGTLQAFAEGMTTRQIADAKKMDLRRVRRVRERLRLKLGVYTNDELMFKAGKEGIIK